MKETHSSNESNTLLQRLRGQAFQPGVHYATQADAWMREAADEIERLRAALRYIMWVKDCGIDGPDGSGKYRNYADEERDLMYETAKKVLAGELLPPGRGGVETKDDQK